MRLKDINVTKIIFIVYCFILVWLVLFKFAFSFADIQGLRTVRSINLIPFYYVTDVGRLHAKEVFLNVIIFVPFGLYLNMLKVSWKKTILYGFLCSFIFEVFQFAFAIGASDITDIITNTFGTAIGTTLYAMIRKFFLNKEKIDKVINGMAVAALGGFCVLFLALFIAN